MRRVSWFVLSCALLVSPVASSAIFTVGGDAACTHGNLLSAIGAAAANGPGMDEVRLATNIAYNAILAPIASHSVTVRGGYSDCADPTPSGRTVIFGSTAGSNGTFTTSGGAQRYLVRLENLELRDGGNATRRGGALRIEGDFGVSLRNTLVTANLAARGGGIYIDGSVGAGVGIDAASQVANNTATVSGGGIFCQINGSVGLEGLVYGNTAQDGGSDPVESGNGGGVALYSSCFMTQDESPGLRGVRANTALRYGGGYYLRNGAQLYVVGSGNDAAKVGDNIAAVAGGGIAVNDNPAVEESLFIVENSWIERNVAPTGAGIGLVAGGNGTISRTLPGASCHDTTICSRLAENERPATPGTCFGAAAYVGPSGVLRIRGTIVEENCPSDSGWAFRQRSDSQLRIDSSVVASNGGSEPFFVEGAFTGVLQIAWSTITGHFDVERPAMFSVPNDASDGLLEVYGTLLGEPFQQMAAVAGGGALPPMDFQYDCLVLPTSYAASAVAIRSVRLAPPYGMIAPATGNFRLASGTALPVDWCDNSVAPRFIRDADGLTTLYDAPRANQFGAYDIGAYELVPDAQFANGFE